MGRSFLNAYRQGARFVWAFPFIFAIPLVVELLQHFVEYKIGMYQSFASFKELADHPARMWVGQGKVLALILLLYWVARHAILQDAERAARLEPVAVKLFAQVVALGVAVAAGFLAIGWFLGELPNAGAKILVGAVLFLGLTFLDLCFTPWKIASALGNPRMTVRKSFAAMRGNLWWSLFFTILTALPLMVVHYALGLGAIGKPVSVAWTMLVVDGFVAAYLGTVISTAYVIVAQRMATNLER